MNDEEKKTKEVIEENAISKEEVVETKEVSDVPASKKGGNKKTFIILGIVIVALAAVLYFAYTMYFNPKQMFIKSVNKGYADFEEFIDKYSEKETIIKPMLLSQDLSVNVKVNENMQDENVKGIIDEINKLKVKTEIGYDQKNKQMLITLGALYDNKDIINIGTYATKGKMYYELKNAFDKYIEIPLDNYNAYFEADDVKIEDVKYILSKTKDSIINNLDKNKFKKSNSTIKIDGKDVKTTKVSYGLSEKSFNELLEKAINDLLKDSKYIDTLATISGSSKDEIKDFLQEMLDDVKEDIKSGDLETDEVIILSAYVKGITNESVGIEIEVKDEDSKIKLSYYKNKGSEQLDLYEDGKEVASAIVKDDKTVIKFGKDANVVTLTINKKEKDKTTTYDYELTAAGVSINGEFTSKILKEEKDKSYESENKITAKMVSAGMELVTITLNGKLNVKYTDKLELPDLSNSVSLEDLTESDYNTIMNKLMENENLKQLIEKISSFSEDV